MIMSVEQIIRRQLKPSGIDESVCEIQPHAVHAIKQRVPRSLYRGLGPRDTLCEPQDNNTPLGKYRLLASNFHNEHVNRDINHSDLVTLAEEHNNRKIDLVTFSVREIMGHFMKNIVSTLDEGSFDTFNTKMIMAEFVAAKFGLKEEYKRRISQTKRERGGVSEEGIFSVLSNMMRLNWEKYGVSQTRPVAVFIIDDTFYDSGHYEYGSLRRTLKDAIDCVGGFLSARDGDGGIGLMKRDYRIEKN